ncbi:MAG: phage holin family protein [Actinobacteria bacterium]|nr:phage holin family protein [Actinomycetota bacterium]MCA1721376.1 phage holin family protein [Actinomycetota bacterium]
MSSTPTSDASLGELVATATRDLSQLMRQEVELAKAEIKRDVAAAGKGAGMFGGAGFSGLFALVFLSIAAAYALGRVVPLGAGFLIVGLVYLLVAAVLGLKGKKSLSGIKAPEKTLETLKDDAAWAKHPTVAPTRRT